MSIEITNKRAVSNEYTWTLSSFEKQGKLWLEWSTDAPFRAQQDQIHVYADGFPDKLDIPEKAWTWADQQHSPWNTGLTAGSDWYCARIAQAAPNGPYVIVNKLITE
jgi:hypothetical protein